MSPHARALLAVFSLALWSDCGGTQECPKSQCGEAWCDGDTVVWCKCSEDADGGTQSTLRRADCAARQMTCAVAAGGEEPRREAVCLDACAAPQAAECRAGVAYACGDYEPAVTPGRPGCASCPDPGGPHEDANGELYPEAYGDLRAWTSTEAACVSCEDDCACDAGMACRDGLCVPGARAPGACEAETPTPPG
jgi:hypothetical protein